MIRKKVRCVAVFLATLRVFLFNCGLTLYVVRVFTDDDFQASSSDSGSPSDSSDSDEGGHTASDAGGDRDFMGAKGKVSEWGKTPRWSYQQPQQTTMGGGYVDLQPRKPRSSGTIAISTEAQTGVCDGQDESIGGHSTELRGSFYGNIWRTYRAG